MGWIQDPEKTYSGGKKARIAASVRIRNTASNQINRPQNYSKTEKKLCLQRLHTVYFNIVVPELRQKI
jgi:hypothetical protein